MNFENTENETFTSPEEVMKFPIDPRSELLTSEERNLIEGFKGGLDHGITTALGLKSSLYRDHRQALWVEFDSYGIKMSLSLKQAHTLALNANAQAKEVRDILTKNGSDF